MDKPRKEKGKRKAKQPQRHPWDEVSLPGAGTNPSEQATILEVLNNKKSSAVAQKIDEKLETTKQDIADEVEPQKTTAASAASELKEAVIETAVRVKEAAEDAAIRVKEAAAAVVEGAAATVKEAAARVEETAAVIEDGAAAVVKEAVEAEREKAAEHAKAAHKQASDDLVSSHSVTDTDHSSSSVSGDSQIPAAAATSSLATPPAGIERQCSDQGNVLDIESHLIETYDEYSKPDEGVGINELPPQQDELIVGPSTIETDASLRTVIEVEPAGAKPNRPIETLVQYSQAIFIENEEAEAEANSKVTEVSDDIKETAEKLVNEIERDVLEILRKCEEAQKELAAEVEIDAITAAVAAKSAETATISAAKVTAAEAEVEATITAVAAKAEQTAAASAAKVAAAESAVEEIRAAVAARAKETAAISAAKVEAAEAIVEETVEAVAAKTKETAAASTQKLAAAEVNVVETIAKVEANAKVTAETSTAKLEAADAQVKTTATTLAEQQKIAEEQTKELAAKIDEKTEPLNNLLDEISETLSQKVDQQLSEVTSILKSSKYGDVSLSGTDAKPITVGTDATSSKQLKVVNVPSPKTPLEKEERQRFLDSLPQIDSNAEAQKLADDCKREYYQSLKKYLVQSNTDKPPVPLQTYQWEDLRRAKERGGYPWTHLYKRPLGPDEEPEIVLLLRKSQELRFTSESPKSLKKVRIDEQVEVKEAERYIQELSETEEEQPQSAADDEENHSLRSESISCVSDSVLATGRPRKSGRLEKIRKYLKRRRSGRSSDDAQSLPGTSANTSRRHSEENLSHSNPQILVNGKQLGQEEKECYPIMKKLKSMADRQKKRLNIKRIHLGKDEKIVLGEETKILKLKKSPKAERSEIPHFIEKQDSDDVLEIVQLDESPSRKRKDDGRDELTVHDVVIEEKETAAQNSIVVPDEIIEIKKDAVESVALPEASESIIRKSEIDEVAAPPKKAPRLRREHVYEEIEQDDMPDTDAVAASTVTTTPANGGLFEMAAVEALKESLAKQHNSTLKDIEAGGKPLPLDRMGSSEEEQVAAAAASGAEKPSTHLLAPLSSIDSTSSEEERNRAHLSPVAEEETDEDKPRIVEETHEQLELKPAIKKEASPAPSDKKVTFSHVEDEAEPHREDIELPAEVQEAQAAQRKWKNMNDHEYEPIGAPADDAKLSFAKEPSPAPPQQTQAPLTAEKSKLTMEIEELRDEMNEAADLQKNLEERYLNSEATTPRTESRNDNELHISPVDASALEELPLKSEKKGFMASAQDRTRKMQAGFKSQAGKIKSKLRTPVKKSPSSSPKAKERKRFKAPEFSKIKMPEIKRPDMSKLKDFKRPEFTKFNKPDMSKFKLPEKFSTLKLRRSKSFKENETVPDDEMSGVTPETGAVTAEAQPQKKMFEFNFGTYPRAFRKKKKPLEPQSSLGTETGTEGLSVIPSTETQPSVESSSSPQGDRGPGPVRSRWADKFSDVSYNDSEGSAYRRYGSEQESFDRESSLERRMKADLEETESEAQSLGIIGAVADTKQFAEFDEENRAIHEISKQRAGEFRRRPIVHQDSDLRSEDSKEVVGWTEKEIEKNKLLRKAELEAEASYLKYPSEERITHETQSTASSGKKVVMEEIDDDEFFLRKRGVSEDNIELRQYISNAIREGYDMPINSLQRVGQSEPIEYGDYDIPPPKPRRLHKTYRPQNESQEIESQRSEFDDDLSVSQNGSDFFGAPKRPMRKGRNRSKYSMDSQDIPLAAEHVHHEQYFDDDEEYLRPPPRNLYKDDGETSLNDLDFDAKQIFLADSSEVNDGVPKPQPPRRRKRNLHETSVDKDSYINGFSGRSVSNSFLQPTEDVIVYRTEHEYPIPLATPERYIDEATVDMHKSRSTSRYDEYDRTSHGADSLTNDNNVKSHLDGEMEDTQEKFVIDMMENDGYAVVRKDHIPKPTPPARRKKFSRSPGERFATTPAVRTPPPARPPPPRGYISSTEDQPVPPRRKSATSLEATSQNYEDDYEEPGVLEQERPESPRNLQSGEVINKMKYRPLPPPPRPPREKRQRGDNKQRDKFSPSSGDKQLSDTGDERIATSSTADSYDPNDIDLEEEGIRFPEVEVSTQTDPLPDDFVCEEFEITDDMKVIEPRIFSSTAAKKTLDELLKEEEQKAATEANARQPTEDEQLARGLQRFRDANQRSLSERSRASSQADRSKSLSRPQTPSAVIIERRVSTPIPSQQSETMLEAALIVRPIDDLDLEEEALRREGLLTDSSQHSKSDAESRYQGEEDGSKLAVSDNSQGPSSEELNVAIEELRGQGESAYESEIGKDEEEEGEGEEEEEGEMEEEEEKDMIERIMRDYGYEQESVERSKYEEDDLETEREKEFSDIEGAKLTSEEREVLSATEEEESPKTTILTELTAREPVKLQPQIAENVHKDPTSYESEHKVSNECEQPVIQLTESTEHEPFFEEPPLPPPRRKSATAIEPAPTLTVMEPPPMEVTPIQSIVPADSTPQTQLPARVGELEVERLRVHALQAGQIMVSQLHGTQISADELECKSGNLVVKNIELPEGFIEDIVERVRSTDREPLLTVETQTSRQGSSEVLSADETAPAKEVIPPPKPPRHRDLDAVKPVAQAENATELAALERLRNSDGQTQTEPSSFPNVPPPVYATTEYLHALGPAAFYNQRYGEPTNQLHGDWPEEVLHKRRHHHHHHRRRSCDSSSTDQDKDGAEQEQESPERTRSRSRSRRSRSTTHPPAEPQTVIKAGRQFLSACGLSLVHIINQLTAYVQGGEAEKDETRLRQVPALVVLFIVITFGLLLYLFSGKSVHTHHWDYFNPPSNEGRPS